ncbi:N-acetylgalactosamine-N, N'-diacetylbacillosaminyl-diphospho-undecaprenol 4-alpha-N-acetylgalactosaminyltransferase [Marinomonas spartinae]|uniref:N-acetylgalactosamine-N, N'-diacetylbacillosaminyl-diphospho-undecaprenol 4-alpha-N-acetylgalactosaminyltransferase n=1 Tax=Marinomonas spartinae TaxID=1792290 RepID=A0A1A8T4X3_9GAMM|nr:glycosyltransferase [Marinomonas spartinae]SBS27007.1 N-acetylgalactosamine-N, N'-diacetylbacillosaminyl-diphospho-undecaprenol 4-alpha-N-acetylgalactosaminyltransferase [Marinomonas spartinae]
MDVTKKITIVIGNLFGGGTERVALNLAKFLAHKGIEIDLVTFSSNENITFLKENNLRLNIILMNAKSAKTAVFDLFLYFFKNKQAQILVFTYELSVLCVLLKIFFRKIYVVSRNNNTFSKEIDSSNSFYRSVIKKVIKIFYKKVDFVINQCEGMQIDLLNNFPDLACCCKVINNPVFLDDILGEYDNRDIPKKFILCVGRLEKQKGFDKAIEAFSFLSKKNDIDLLIIGKGKEENELKKLANKFGLKERVKFLGFQKDIHFFYEKALLTLLTSQYEGFPNVLLESISLGTPVVSFDCPNGPNEIILNGVNGYLVDIGNTLMLSEKIEKILNYPLDKDSIIATSQKYTIEVIAEEFLAVFSNKEKSSTT